MPNKFRQTANDYQNHRIEANRMRGEILSNCIDLERWLDELLAIYFCEMNEEIKKSFLSVFLITGKVSFQAKVSIFKSILPSIKGIGEDDKALFQEIIKDLYKRIIPARNAIAHRALEEIDFSKSYKEKKTVYKDLHSDDKFEIDNCDFAQILHSSADYTTLLIGLVGELEFIFSNPAK